MSGVGYLEPRLSHATSADGLGTVTVYVALLLLLPARLVFGPLGAAGSPASLFGLACLILWAWRRVRFPSSTLPTSSSPSRKALVPVALVATSFLGSYLTAMTRPITRAEVSAADIGLLGMASWLGVLLWTRESIIASMSMRRLIGRIVVLGSILSGLGLAQYLTGQSFVDRISIPGLVDNQPALGLAQRDGFNRPAGTAIHAIEFSVVVTMLLPLAITLARHPRGPFKYRGWIPVALMVAVVPLAISRSAIVGAVVGLAVLMPAWGPAARRVGLACACAAGVVTFILVPGLLGNLGRLFFDASDDPSARSRTDSYGIVMDYFVRSPAFGRGFGTFLPTHRILDNQYLGLLVDVGLVGLTSFVLLLVAGVRLSLWCRRRAASPFEGEMGQALSASISVGAVGMALFDGFSFPMAAGLLFLCLGLAGSLAGVVGESAVDGRTVTRRGA